MPTYIAGLAIVICIGYILSLSHRPRLVIVNNTGVNLVRESSDYAEAAHKLLSSSWDSFSKITINSTKLETNMLNQFPELSKVVVTLPIMGRRPVFQIEITSPSIVLQTDNGTYLLNKDGRAVFTSDQADPKSLKKLPLVVDRTSLQIDVGTRILSTTQASFITEIVAQLRANNLSIKSILLPSIPEELHLKLQNKTYLVKMDMLSDARVQAGGLVATLRKLKQRNIEPKSYIDVRVEEKVYYK